MNEQVNMHKDRGEALIEKRELASMEQGLRVGSLGVCGGCF